MRIGLFIDELAVPVETMVERTRAAAEAGYPAAWWGQRWGWDALTAIAVAGREVPGIALGTAVVPSYPRHPLALAAQALTVQGAIGNRLTLGLGVAHRSIVEGQFGYSYDRPARHLREYLTALGPLLRGESVDFRGETLSAVGSVDAPGAQSPSVLVGALGPLMLKVAGELADGTITLWAGPATLDKLIVPAITAAATAAGRHAPRVVATHFVSVTSDPDAIRAQVARDFAAAAGIPSYRAIFDREGAAGPQDTVIAGDEAEVTGRLHRLAEAGATEALAILLGSPAEQARTTALLTSLSD